MIKYIPFDDPYEDSHYNYDYYRFQELVHIQFEIDLKEINASLTKMVTNYSKRVFLLQTIPIMDIQNSLNHYFKLIKQATNEGHDPDIPLFWSGMIDASKDAKKNTFSEHIKKTSRDEQEKRILINSYETGYDQWYLFCQVKKAIGQLNEGNDVDLSVPLKDYSGKSELYKCGFFDLPKIANLKSDKQNILVDRLLLKQKGDLPFKVALMDILGFIDFMLSKHSNSIRASKIAEIINVSGDDVRKAITALTNPSAPKRYNSYSKLEEAKEFVAKLN